MEKKPIDNIITKNQQRAIKIIKALLNEMHNDIKLLMDMENQEKGAKSIEEKSVRITKICIALQSSLDIQNGGVVAKNLDHLYKHIRFSVGRVMDSHDFSYLGSAEKVTAEINSGWSKISTAA